MGSTSNQGHYQKHVKRVLDIFLATFLVIVLAVPTLVIWILYWFVPGSSAFFIQERIGLGEKTFRLLKFRTLSNDTARPIQERRMWLGDFLRFTSLDELPQLINILRGDMSFVGPRPLPVEYLPMYSDEQRRRHLVRPGLTGWAQVNGRHSIPWEKKFTYDIFYVDNISFALDFKIVIKTIVLLLSFRKDRSLLEQKFTGNKNA